MRARARAAGAAIGLMVLVLAGCGGGDGDDDATPGAEETMDEASPTEDEMTDEASDDAEDSDDSEDADDSDDMAGGATVMLASTDLGDVLVDAAGMTLYMFTADAQGDSTCYDACATAWPPLTVDGAPAAGEGANDAKLGTVERTDGTTQVTYNGWPLYYWAQDSAPGDTTGQAVNDVWWVLDADGEPIRD